jgi:predicted ArsR family transcriptional regulator
VLEYRSGVDGPEAVTAVAVLADRARREIYAFARGQGRPITRDEAAAHLGISRKLAAFHLDKLVAAGLLAATVGQRAGPGRIGRPPKAYEPTDAEIEVSVPARRYDLAAQILLDAVVDADRAGVRAGDAALHAGRRHGVGLGRAARTSLRGGPIGPERTLSLVEQVALDAGYEPVRAGPRVLQLRNCPFSRLTDDSREVVCGVNVALFAGIVEGIGGMVRVELAPWEGHCCVRLTA